MREPTSTRLKCPSCPLRGPRDLSRENILRTRILAHVRSFIGRKREGVLGELADSSRAELIFVLYGRRRVGDRAPAQFCRERQAVLPTSPPSVRDRDNLRGFRDALREGLDDPLIDGIEFSGLVETRPALRRRATTIVRLVVVLDEFPYLCDGNKGLPSLVQQFWDRDSE